MPAPADLKRIVVGVDGSEHATAAIEWAIKLASLTSAEVIAVHAVDAPVYGLSGYEPVLQLDPEWQAEMRKLFDEWCSPLRAARVSFKTVFEEGRPATVIAKVAESFGADLVVVGRRGRGSLTELVLGSVSHELSHQCKRPVLLISQRPRLHGDAAIEVARERADGIPAGAGANRR
jgi:nucleotide-binding universal stress UspA family protein